jgi:hypothetical protein
MFAGVYARSSAPMSGGFVGQRPAADPAALENARAQIRGRLAAKVRTAAGEHANDATFAFPDLARVTFESLALTTGGEGEVRVVERAHIELPLFSNDDFAYAVGQSVSADVEPGAISLIPREGFAAQRAATSSDPLALAPLSFTLRGQGQLVWKVDVGELAEALAGRDEAAFQSIVQEFPGIEEAHARIQPFWQNSFPAEASAIKVKIQQPEPPAW